MHICFSQKQRSVIHVKIVFAQYANDTSEEMLHGSHYLNIKFFSHSCHLLFISSLLSLSLFLRTGSASTQPDCQEMWYQEMHSGTLWHPNYLLATAGLASCSVLGLWHFPFRIPLRFTGIERACWAGRFINTSPLHYCDHQPWAAQRSWDGFIPRDPQL